MDLVDLITEKKFLGQEFLTWLWWKSEQRGGTIALPDIGDITVVFEKHMLLESGTGEASEKIICSGLQTELQEARTGLQMGKKLEQARIVLGHGGFEYVVTIAAGIMEFRNVRLPKTEGTEGGSGDNPEEIEGVILERIYLVEQLIHMVNDLFRLFLDRRLGAAWQEELQAVRKWVAAPAGRIV